MRVTGPDWPSTRMLQEAVRDIESEKILHWGQGGKNGLEQLQKFKENGINCPKFTTSLTEAKDGVRRGEEWWGRKLHHTQGSDIVEGKYTTLPTTPGGMALKWITTRRGNRVKRMRWVEGVRGGERWDRRWEGRDFWVLRIPEVVNEYRQHVFNGEAIRRGKKIFAPENIERRRIVEGVRSRKNGWHIDYGPFDSPRELREIAKRAVSVLGYTWGAVDIVETRDGKLWVLEVNSAPSLKDENTLAAYVKGIKKWVGEEG